MSEFSDAAQVVDLDALLLPLVFDDPFVSCWEDDWGIPPDYVAEDPILACALLMDVVATALNQHAPGHDERYGLLEFHYGLRTLGFNLEIERGPTRLHNHITEWRWRNAERTQSHS